GTSPGEAPESLAVLDAGAGPGRLSLRLATMGHRVCLLDPSPRMLALARAHAASLPDSICATLRYCQADLTTFAAEEPPGTYDLVLLHTVLEYLPEPDTALAAAAGLLREGGLLSVVFANRDAEPLRRAISERRSDRVREALATATHAEKLFGLPRHLLAPLEMRDKMEQAGLAVVAERGIRVFADYLLADGGSLADLFELEVEVGKRFPYMYIARYVHTLGRKQADTPQPG
ncbi:MAG: methyltransferase domain-containing protein, partial [Chloroflexota bacterium]